MLDFRISSHAHFDDACRKFAATHNVKELADKAGIKPHTLYNKLNGSTMEQMQALGYIMGAADALDTATVCAPLNVTAGQMNDMMKNYLENYPAVRHLPADSIINVVLGRMWPCEKKKGQSL